MKISLYDTTLRDGNQDRKISLSLADKLQIARILDHFGFDYIEGGWPNPSNPTDEEFFQKIKEIKLKHAKIAAFGSTRRPKVLPENDPLLQALVKSGAPVKTIFGKSWDLHVTDVIRTTLEENLDMIESSVAYLKEHSEEVIYDAEHFFDGYKANPEYAIETLKAAELGHADCIVLCDTNGGTMPWELEEIVKEVKKKISTPIGIHVHNDAGLAVCNSIYAVKNGATMVQGVVNGYGERCGNANLTTIAADLHFKMGAKFFAAKKMARLRQLSSNVDQIVNLPSDVHAPYVGDAAFAHKGGAHIDGVMKVSRSFEHIDPHAVGNDRVFVTSDQAGGSLVVEKLKAIKPGIDKKDPVVGKLLTLIKERENAGWHFDSAEASFKMLVYRQLGMVEEPFKVLNYRVIEDKTPQGVSVSQATVKLQVGDKISHQVSEGDGPVNALDAALRKALLPFFPNMAKVKLDDYKVRVLGSNVASDATVRVWTTFGDEKGYWNVVGVSSNIIEASWMAFVDGLTYKILVDNKAIESAYKHIDVKPVEPAKAKEATAPEKAKKLTARKVRNLAGVSRKK
ncbi:citramalate synthase [Fibrobacter sp.]|uniref:citramalate synthase n=1 Tax=Fibrobacter sp. TaxID=35828 RepID=UPI0025BC6A40|nr:citramalate synthase [Fibrobacter sp.]MBS7271887.1 citramalate synthase [Fibrobacter sp.]MDD7496798.1 citramalate synthase [Fibrobacter sp.]MDY5723419.1 citramalate synthase [Fibrobacter sp.]